MDREEWKAVFERASEAAHKDCEFDCSSENYTCMKLLDYIKKAL